MSQCYLSSESKTSMTKLYFEVFIAKNFWSFNKKDPVYTKRICIVQRKERKKKKFNYYLSKKEKRVIFWLPLKVHQISSRPP